MIHIMSFSSIYELKQDTIKTNKEKNLFRFVSCDKQNVGQL